MEKLEQVLGAAEIPEAMLTEVEQAGARGEAFAGNRGRGVREEDLTAVARGHRPGGAVDRGAEVVAATLVGLTRMHAHADAEGHRRGPGFGGELPLRGQARLDGLRPGARTPPSCRPRSS